MSRRKRRPEEKARREKIRELLKMTNIDSLEGMDRDDRKDVLGMRGGENESHFNIPNWILHFPINFYAEEHNS